MIVRRLAALISAVALVAVPAIATAAPGRATAPSLPPAAYVHARMPLTAPATSGRHPATADGAGRTTAAPSRLPTAIGASLYVDDCRGTQGDAVDLRRTSMAMSGDRATVQFTLRACVDSPSLDALTGQRLAWQVTPTRSRTHSGHRR